MSGNSRSKFLSHLLGLQNDMVKSGAHFSLSIQSRWRRLDSFVNLK